MTLELGFGQSELAWGDTYMKLDRVRAVLDGVASLRMHRLRTIAGQAFMLPHKDQPPNFQWLDRAVAEAADRGIRLLITMNKTLPLNYSNTPTIVANWGQAIANRYGVTGFTYNGKFYPPYQPVEIEFWNEVNLATYWYPIRPADYTEYLKATYNAVKAVLPGTNSIVVSAGLAGACDSDNLGNVKDSVWYATSTDPAKPGMIASGALAYCDAFGFHPYSSDGVFHAIPPTSDGNVFIKLQKIRDAIDAAGYPSLPIWFTEWGFCVVDAGSPETQRDWDIAQLAIFNDLKTANPTKYGPAYRYNYNDDHNKPTSREATYGVTYNPDFSKKPSWYVFDAQSSPVGQGQFASVGALSAKVAGLKKPKLSSTGQLSVKLSGRVAATLGSTGTLRVTTLKGGNRPALASEGTLSVVAGQQRIFVHDFGPDGNTKPTTLFDDFGPYDYFVLSGKALNGSPSANGIYYDGGFYKRQTLSADQFIEVTQDLSKSFADRSLIAAGRVASDYSTAIFATMRWGGTDSSQILVWDAATGTVTEKANGTEKLASANDRLGLDIDGDTYTVYKNGLPTDCQWIDSGHTYTGRNNKGVGFGFQHKRVGGVNYGAPGMSYWSAKDKRIVVPAVIPSRTPQLSSDGALSVAAAGARNGNYSGAGTLATKAVGLKKPALSSAGALTCTVAGSLHGNLSGAGTLSTKAAALQKPALNSVGALTCKAAGARNGNYSGAGTLTTSVLALKKPALASTGTLTTAAVALKNPALSGTGTLSVSVTRNRTTPVASQGKRTAIASSSTATTAFGSGYVPQANDIIFFFVRSGTVQGITVPSGWVNPLGGNTVVSTSAHSVCAIYHVVTSAEASAATTTYTATNLWNAAISGATYACVVRGVDPNSIVDDANSTFSSTATTTNVFAGLTGSNLQSNSLVLKGTGADGTSTYTDPSGLTLQAKNTGGQSQGALYTDNTATTAGTNVAAQNITSGSSVRYASITVALSGN